jgi:hypothetical protein
MLERRHGSRLYTEVLGLKDFGKGRGTPLRARETPPVVRISRHTSGWLSRPAALISLSAALFHRLSISGDATRTLAETQLPTFF